jgi:cyclophilin family peptidyl-prolyl cis-trans isomerase
MVRIGGVLLTVVIVIVAVGFFAKDDPAKSKQSPAKAAPTTTTGGPTTTEVGAVPAVCPPTDGSANRATKFATPFPDDCTDPAKTYTAKFDTTEGSFTVALDSKKAPKTVNNFVSLSRWKFYDGLTFHRIIKDFMNQGGDPKGDGTGGPGYEFTDELPGPNEYQPGSLAMANSGPDTNGSQFFVVATTNGAKQLQPNYSLFGQVTDGLDVVTKMNNVTTGQGDKPTTPVTITSVTISES